MPHLYGALLGLKYQPFTKYYTSSVEFVGVHSWAETYDFQKPLYGFEN